MQHVLIGFYIVTFITGFISIYHVNVKYAAYTYSFLRTYKYHILVFNLYVLSLAVTRYYDVNIVNTVGGVGSISVQHAADALLLFQMGIEYFGMLLIAYTLVKMLYQMQERPMENPIKYSFIFMLTLSTFAYGTGVTLFLKGEPHWLDLFCDILSGFIFLPVIGIFAFSSIRMNHAKTGHREFSTNIFLSFYLIALSVLFLQNFVIFRYRNVFVAAIILSMNLFPMLWSTWLLKTKHRNNFSLNICPENIERIVSEYNISDREREIFECILQGLTNKEIQERLFISPHTVKNHNYNLYKKLGVGNRGELLRKTMEYQNNN
jgi:DNA-binding CsgD family transcriptional regulator